MSTPDYDLPALRAQFEVVRSGLTYLNHAGMSPLADPVRDALLDAAHRIARLGSGAYDELATPLEPGLKQQIGSLLNTDPAGVALIQNTSTGINLLAHSLPLSPGDSVLVTNEEFPSNVYPWLNLAGRGIETRIVPSAEGGVSVDALRQHCDRSTRVVSISAIQFFSGRREQLAEIGQFCADHGLWLIVDAMQAAGIIPIDMQAMGLHAVVAGGQKALMGPPGQGFMALSPQLLDQLHPVFAGPLSVRRWERWMHYELDFREDAARFDLGTFNLTGMAGLSAALHLLMALTPQAISEWVTHLSNLVIEDLLARGYRVATPRPSELHAHIVTFEWPGDPVFAVQHLKDNGIILRPHADQQGRQYLRISSHCYNTEQEVLSVAETLEGVR